MKIKIYENYGENNQKLLDETDFSDGTGEFIFERGSDGKFAIWQMPNTKELDKRHSNILRK